MQHYLSIIKTNATKQRVAAQSGFTLTEAMIVVAILAIGAALAAPSFISQMQRSEITRTARDFQDALEAAKRGAYISGRPHTVCPVDDVTITSPVCVANWDKFNGSDDSETKGWVVFQDSDGDGVYDAGEKLISRSSTTAKMAALSWTGSSAIITLTPRQITSNTGTMRVYAHKNGTLPTWSGSTTAVSGDLYEMRVSLSGLGQIKFYK